MAEPGFEPKLMTSKFLHLIMLLSCLPVYGNWLLIKPVLLLGCIIRSMVYISREVMATLCRELVRLHLEYQIWFCSLSNRWEGMWGV